MFKFSKTALMVLGVGIMLVVSVALYLAYAQYTSRRDALYLTIEAANKKYAQVNNDKRALEPQLTQLQQKVQELKSASTKARGEFPDTTIQSIEYDEELNKLADDAGVKIALLTATDSVTQQDGNITYIVTDFTFEVTGGRVNILDFLHRVAISQYFTTATVNSVNLEESVYPTPTPGAPEVPDPVDFSTLSLTVTIFRYEGE